MAPHDAGPREPEDPRGFPTTVPAPRYNGKFANARLPKGPAFSEVDVSDKPREVRRRRRLTPDDITKIRYAYRQRLETLQAVDDLVADVVRTVEESGQLDNTLIVFTSDNGILYGEHRWTKKEAPYEEAIRVPLVMRWDAAGWGGAGTQMPGTLALNIDLAPTIADAAGIPHPATDGRSLLPVLAGNARWRSDFLVEHLEGTNPIPTYCAVRSERWMYVRYTTGEEELYDLRDDPYELENLAANPADHQVLEGRRARLRELCSPVPPGYGDRTDTSVPIALGALGVLVIVEAALARRRARNPGVAR
jgi:arylsulfatase A-like enzyme